MRRLRKKPGSACRRQQGFTVIELLVASVVLVVGLIALSQFFASSGSRVLQSDIRSVLHQVATKEMESIRGLPYEDVGIQNGLVPGVLAASEVKTVDGVRIRVDRSVLYKTDSTYTGPYPANYRRVTVTVTAVQADGQDMAGIEGVSFTSYVAGGAEGGSILVKVQDSQGQPVEDALFTITNTVKGISYTAPDQLTDELGSMLVPGLTPDSGNNYYVSASKTGYSTDTAGGYALTEAGLQEVVLTIDRLSSMYIRTVDQVTGLDIPNMRVNMVGPKGYTNTVYTGTTGYTLYNLRFSTDSDQYILSVPSGQGYVPGSDAVTLAPGATNFPVVLELLPIYATTTTVIVTTTTVPSATTTTEPSATTTVAGDCKLTVTVKNHWGGNLGSQATIQLGVVVKSSPSNQVQFKYLQPVTYELTVSASGYEMQTTTVRIYPGSQSITIYLDHS